MNSYMSAAAGAVLYGLYNALLPNATRNSSVIVFVAISTTFASIIGWTVLFANGKWREVQTFELKQWVFVAMFGALAYTADYIWTRSFSLPGNIQFNYGMIASVAIVAVGFTLLVNGQRPNGRELAGLLLCVSGAWLLYTGRV